MNWYSWTSQADFDAWHQTVIDGLGLPKVGMNAATGQPRPDAQMTTAYTSVTEVGADDWRAPVDIDIALSFADGLGATSEAPPAPEELV